MLGIAITVTVSSLADFRNCGNMRTAMPEHHPPAHPVETRFRWSARIGFAVVAASLCLMSACDRSSDSSQTVTRNPAGDKHSLVWDAGSWDDTTWN
ncbi:MAG TPA: hypothetical protein VNO35_25545 [Steroidobacteraceae bacterium]|nr:hypothetical protein [Steroidobacteraceae bacterium]